MAHNLATIAGRVAMAYQGRTPWHELGTRAQSITDVETALKLGNLDWTVSKQPVFRMNPDRSSDVPYLQIPDRYSVTRDVDGAHLGTVGPDMTLLQNVDAFGVLADACKDHGVTIESVGALGNGARTWMLAKMPDTFTVVTEPSDDQGIQGDPSEFMQRDDIRGYFLILNGHDGTAHYSARFTPIRVVCQNTLNAAVQDNNLALVKLRHTSRIENRAAMVASMISKMHAAMMETRDTYATFARKRMTLEQVASYIDAVFPNPDPAKEVSAILRKRREAVASLVFSGKGASLAGSNATAKTSTVWAVYNAVTEYLDHVRPAETEKPEVAKRQNESAIFGSGFDLKLAALNQARRLVAA